MAAYIVALGVVQDEERFAQYAQQVGPTLAPHSVEVVAIDAAAEVMEGNAPYPRVVLLKFPSKDHARNWKKSAEYQAAAEHRHASSEHVFYLVDEYVPPSA